jgi:pyruvate-formate lyase-activating enzyme
MECLLELQGLPRGKCLTVTTQGNRDYACQVTLRKNNGQYERLIKSHHLSRPEDYYSVYQSGCNHDCLKCHSAEFSKEVNGEWISTDLLAAIAKEYARHVTVVEPHERATMWHAEDLCYHCGSCLLSNRRSEFCPNKLLSSQIVFSPQGLGPARNILAFTGGDLTCQPDYYAEAARKIKEATDNQLWVLVESNGYALTRENLQILKDGGVDSYWLDIKAYNNEVYKKLCGTPNKTVLESLEHIVNMDFAVEVLTLFIPDLVESDQHQQIAKLIADVNVDIPITLLAFFPSYKLLSTRKPTFDEMLNSYNIMKGEGLTNIRLGNIGVFASTDEQLEKILEIRKNK